MSRHRIRPWNMGGDRWSCIVEIKEPRFDWWHEWTMREFIIRTNHDGQLMERLEGCIASASKGKVPPYALRSAEVLRCNGIEAHSTTGEPESWLSLAQPGSQE